jgi:hypothetical protein
VESFEARANTRNPVRRLQRTGYCASQACEYAGRIIIPPSGALRVRTIG